jgi:Na+-translocating ferredoxin:NAD+ oxidoreductase RNF subunit RnfB
MVGIAAKASPEPVERQGIALTLNIVTTNVARMPQQPATEVAVVDRAVCDACGLCMPLCPPAAIAMRRDGLLVSAAVCTGCRKCIAPCPVGALTMVPNPLLALALHANVTPVTPIV